MWMEEEEEEEEEEESLADQTEGEPPKKEEKKKKRKKSGKRCRGVWQRRRWKKPSTRNCGRTIRPRDEVATPLAAGCGGRVAAEEIPRKKLRRRHEHLEGFPSNLRASPLTSLGDDLVSMLHILGDLVVLDESLQLPTAWWSRDFFCLGSDRGCGL